MALRLRVLGTKAERLATRSSQVFGVHGGRVGRAADNEWVLPDPDRYMSGHHARIEYRQGEWCLVDTSSNGTFLNGDATAIGRDRACVLRDGDRVRMGDYDFLVSINRDNDFPPDASAIAAYDAGALAPDFAVATHGDLGAELDLSSLLASPVPPPDDPQPAASHARDAGVMARPAPPPPAAAPTVTYTHVPDRSPTPVILAAPAVPLRTEFDGVALSDAFGQPIEPPAARGAAPAAGSRSASPRPESISSGTALQAFCRGAGLDPATLPNDDASRVLVFAGQIVREMTLGLMTSLQLAAEQKVRYAGTEATPQPDNNPFKATRSVDELLTRLFVSRSSRQPALVDAIRNGYSELRRHDQAAFTALQDSLGEYVARFAPDRLEDQFETSLKRSNVAGIGNPQRYWELYAELYRVLAQANAEGLPHAFAEEFAKAYDTAAAELRSGRDGHERRGTG